MALLEAKNMGIKFGGLSAVSNFDFKIDKNELVGLIGPNGAGKTTAFNLITGVYTPTEGSITFEGKDIVKSKASKINRMGIARTFQNIRLFKDMTVIDNVKVGFNSSMKNNPLEAIFRLPRYWKDEKICHEKSLEILDVFDLAEYKDVKSDNLPYGKQRKLEIARALATNPSLLLLDEPAAGMNPSETQELMETIDIIRHKFKVAILLIEHDMNLVMGICERLVVLDHGQIIGKGTPEEIRNNEEVIHAYLG
ncbi:MAG: ABC transporter ATP-binding protein [Lachnospirales bacterium]